MDLKDIDAPIRDIIKDLNSYGLAKSFKIR